MENGTPPASLRAMNDRIYNVLWGVSGDLGDFVCECGDKDCVAHVELHSIDYATRHERAVLARGHRQLASAAS